MPHFDMPCPHTFTLLLLCTLIALLSTHTMERLQLVEYPSEGFRRMLMMVLLGNIAGTFVWDRLMHLVFAPTILFAGFSSITREVRQRGFASAASPQPHALRRFAYTASSGAMPSSAHCLTPPLLVFADWSSQCALIGHSQDHQDAGHCRRHHVLHCISRSGSVGGVRAPDGGLRRAGARNRMRSARRSFS